MRAMFNGLHDPSLPGLLTALRSADPSERDEALTRLHRAVHVHPDTIAGLPFLFTMATDPATPDRAAIVALLVDIGREIDDAAAALRERAATFAALAADPDVRVRRAAIPALGLFRDDAQQAAVLLRERLPAEPGAAERILIVEALATLALRLPAAADDILLWFGRLAGDPAADLSTRLAAVIHRARCTPGRISDDLVPAVISLLWTITSLTPPGAPSPGDATLAGLDDGVPPEIAAAFADLERLQRVHAPTTGLLRTLHDLLGGRIIERTAVLAEQLRSPDTGWRLDAIRMSGDLMTRWRGDHADLIRLLARQVADDDPEVAAAAAAVLGSCHPIASPAREALAARVVALGPREWAAPQPRLRRAHQEAVVALARLGDERAAPSLFTALTADVDAWRAVEAARFLPGASDLLAPLVADRLSRADHSRDRDEMGIHAMLTTLSMLGEPGTVPAIAAALTAAVRHGRAGTITAVLTALASFGPLAESALADIRPLIDSTDAEVRHAALAALSTVSRDLDEILPRLLALLDPPTSPSEAPVFSGPRSSGPAAAAEGPPGDADMAAVRAAVDVLKVIGPPAAAAVPRLRELVGGGREWVRVPCAAALWEIGGEPEAPVVIEALLSAWQRNGCVADPVVACLRRMGPSARPALPHLIAELAQSRRGDGGITDIEADERLQRACRNVIAHLGQ
ncbi:hypothetical protein Aut01nite_37100 [Actinoplanes utahensis]|nr:hypothetical protein Aut01nite_37100 [Actinoplanes utahensis]